MKRFKRTPLAPLMAALVAGQLLFSCMVQTPPPVRDVMVHPEPDNAAPVVDEGVIPEAPPLSAAQTDKFLADRLAASGNIRDALYLYNKALTEAGDDESLVAETLSAVREALPMAHPQLIQGLMEDTTIVIPKPLLLFQLGVSQADAGDVDAARQTLLSFVDRYPEDDRVTDAYERLQALRKVVYEPNTIGCLLPLTGRFSLFGKRALKGVELALLELSQQYDQDIRIIVKDTESEDEIAAQRVRELDQENVSAVVGPIVTAEAAGQEAQKLGVPMIALTQKQQVSQDRDYVFTNFLTPEMQVEGLVAYAFQHLGVSRFAILYPDDKYGNTYMNLFWDSVDKVGGTIAGVESYGQADTDFTTVLKKITGLYYPVPRFLKEERKRRARLFADSEAEFLHSGEREVALSDMEETADEEEDKPIVDFQALFIPDAPGKVSLILPQLAYNDIEGIYLLGPNIWHDDQLINQAKGYMKNVVITEGFFAGSSRQASMRFATSFEMMYGEAPKLVEAVAYDTTRMAVETAMEKGIGSRREFRDALAGNRIFNGATGRTMFGRNGAAHKELVYLTVQRNRFVEITR